MNDNKDFLGKYMRECPKCGHRYNKNLHGNKCPDCGYRDRTIKDAIPLVVVTILVLLVMLMPRMGLYFINPVFLLIGANIILYFCGFNESNIEKYGNCYHDTIVNKQYYRLLTSGFTHNGIVHIACNMFSLYNLGTFVYYQIGTVMFLIFYFVCLLLGGLISTYMHHNSGNDYVYSVGASGAVCGLLGFYIVYIFMLSIDFRQTISYIYKALLPLAITAFSPNIDNLGHLSGLIVGVVLGFVINFIFVL